MAIGFTPKYVEEYPLGVLSRSEFLILALESTKNMKWTVVYQSDSGLIANTSNGFFSWNAELTVRIDNEVATVVSASTGTEIMDWGKNKKNVATFLAHLEGLIPTLSKDELQEKYTALSGQLEVPENDHLKLPPATTAEQFFHFLALFRPVEGYFITPILVNLNILVFLFMAVSGVNIMLPDQESLLNWGANFRPVTLEGQWWRLITSCFVHIGILHLLLNMYALLYIGVLLEPRLGALRFITAYLLTGILASMTSLWWHDFTISAGASGAIFGLYGIFLVLLMTNLIDKTTRKQLLTSILAFVGYSLLYGLRGGIDNAAHIGGLIAGIGIGCAFFPSLKQPEDNSLKFGTISILGILVVTCSLTVYKGIPNDLSIYDSQMKKFVAMESMALEAFHLPPNTPKDIRLSEIKDRGIYYWNENIKLMDSFEELDLPHQIKTRNQRLKEYCEIRIKSYELIYKAISEESDQYEQQIKENNSQIEAKIKEFKEEQTN